VAQFVLPPLAARILTDRLARDGRVVSVSVSAFPAIELLWQDADRVAVRMATYHPTVSRLGDLLAESSGVGSLDVRVGTLRTGLLTVHNADLRKRGDRLLASAEIYESDLRDAIPGLTSVIPVASGGGALQLQGTGSVLGVRATVDVTVEPVAGAIRVVPPGLLSFLQITVWKDPRVHVDSVSGRPTSQGMEVAAAASLQ
jgi:hypothetical protein